MKELILVRHAKSSWDYDADDADRPLKERGISDAHRVAAAVAARLPEVQAVFSSPANRALHTCMILMRELGIPLEKLRVHRDLYDFSGTSVRDFVHGLDEGLHRVMVFGHNHAMTYIANAWGNKYVENVPTAGLVYLDLQAATWKEVSTGKTRMTVFPGQLK
ncbi:SixA phosphatase family protein [Robiginitalea marina]|uniref:Histidine phosphatase family protein n=1 Tax=Robiginitalea marina TaxID=2954105 RepID=A0ABT1AUT4_9FLAO|nr:histidine phosphatase family protein [Robiginitalea marina]MCO5723805.1 histidine phosphatase family protein [Robiginitalea marina]